MSEYYIHQSRPHPEGRWVDLGEPFTVVDADQLTTVMTNVAAANIEAGREFLRVLRCRQVSRWETYGEPVTVPATQVSS